MSRLTRTLSVLATGAVVFLGVVTPATAAAIPAPATAAVTLQAPAKTLKTTKPVITGSAVVGKTLTVKTGTWTAKTKLKIQWFASGTKIAKATKPTLKLTKKLAGKTITVKVTGSKAGYQTKTVTSKKTAKVKAAKAAASVKIVRYKNCTELRKVYPHGVARTGGYDRTSGTPVTGYFVNDALYDANSHSDRDKDGVACEA